MPHACVVQSPIHIQNYFHTDVLLLARPNEMGDICTWPSSQPATLSVPTISNPDIPSRINPDASLLGGNSSVVLASLNELRDCMCALGGRGMPVCALSELNSLLSDFSLSCLWSAPTPILSESLVCERLSPPDSSRDNSEDEMYFPISMSGLKNGRHKCSSGWRSGRFALTTAREVSIILQENTGVAKSASAVSHIKVDEIIGLQYTLRRLRS
jgi:hypothetical protein